MLTEKSGNFLFTPAKLNCDPLSANKQDTESAFSMYYRNQDKMVNYCPGMEYLNMY